MAAPVTGNSAITRALERLEFGKTVMKLARHMNGDKELAEQVYEVLNESRRVDTTKYETNSELMNWLAREGLRAHDDKHMRVGKFLERLVDKRYSRKARMKASDDLFDVGSHPQQAQRDEIVQGCMSKPTHGGARRSAVGTFPMMKPGAKRRGHAVIINVEQFTDKTLVQRHGSKSDVERLVKLAEWLRFKVWCEEDAQGNLLDTIKSTFAKMEYCESDWLMCFLMSHGKSGYIMSSDGTAVDLKLVYGAARDHTVSRALANSELPKIFFVQACRTESTSDDSVEATPFDEPPSVDSDVPGLPVVSGLNPHGNFLLSHATRDGDAAYLKVNGSVYFQKVDKLLREYVPQKEYLTDILTMVNDQCKKEVIDYNGSPVFQVTSTTTELSKHIWLDYG